MASREQIVEMALSLFDSYDEDSSGYLETKEFKKVLKEVLHEISKTTSIDEKKLNQQFTIYDSNSDSKISRKEFVKVIENFVNSHVN
jgi:Ca2+-binding EF-hand superfamily protein